MRSTPRSAAIAMIASSVPTGAQRAVGQFGGERRVPPVQAGVAQDAGQRQVRVRVVAVHRGDRLVGRPARRVDRSGRRAGSRRGSRSPLRPVRAHRAGRVARRLGRRAVIGVRRWLGHRLAERVVAGRAARPGPSRGARIGFLPAARTSPSTTGIGRGADQHPASLDHDLAGRQRGARPVPRRTGPELDPLAPQGASTRPAPGVHARMRRSTANAGSVQRTSASSTGIFGASETPSAGCGTAVSDPASIASSTAHQQLRALDRTSRPSRSPAVSVGPDVLDHGAEHRAGVQARLELEHRRAGHLVAVQHRVLHRRRATPRRQQREVQVDPAVPRDGERGRRDQRAVGDDRHAVRRDLAQPVLELRLARAGPGSAPRCRARRPTRRPATGAAGGPGRRRRPGRVTTATSSCAERGERVERRQRDGRRTREDQPHQARRPVRECPARTPPGPCGLTLTTGRPVAVPLGRADLLHRPLAGVGVEPVEEQHAVEVVGLVLHAAGHQAGADDLQRVAVLVEALRDDVHAGASCRSTARGWTGSPPGRPAPPRPGSAAPG